jgi:hypothetical protein
MVQDAAEQVHAKNPYHRLPTLSLEHLNLSLVVAHSYIHSLLVAT